MAWTWKKGAIVVGGTIAGGALIAWTGGLAAPFIGSIIGSSMGLSGAAAASAGLAALGGGTLAAGAGGIAGGTALVAAGAGLAGAAGGALASSVAASSLRDSKRCKTCDAPLDEKTAFCPQCGKAT